MKIQSSDFTGKKSLNRSLSLLFMIAFIMISIGAIAAPKKAKFTGDWTLSTTKSYIAEYGEMMAVTNLKITQKGKKLVMESSGTSQTGESYSFIEKFTLDGKECENTIFETTKAISTVEWSDDKQSITITSTVFFDYQGTAMEVFVIETLKLTDEGQSLSYDQTAKTDYGDIANTLIYDKK